jgi:mannose-6-phosphate isomerase
MDAPIVFKPLAMERVWGGRRFEHLAGKELPAGVPVGELWEVVDREDAQSVVVGGRWSGSTLHELWSRHREEVFGVHAASLTDGRFPLLVKLLDAADTLSVQVHPPADKAAALGGEPKTEVWYFLESDPGACVYAGLKSGTTRARFEELLRGGGVEQALHRVPVRTGGSIFIPSGRLHAIGGGNLIVEIQQNSDTTYRVFDWNRPGLDGKPRALHLDESLASIDFADFEPGAADGGEGIVADCEYFHVRKIVAEAPVQPAPEGGFALVVPLDRAVRCGGTRFERGQFFLIPAGAAGMPVVPEEGAAGMLVTTLPPARA